MSFYSAWQPLVNEDAQTGLVFGFLRHARAELALKPWLEETLGRPVSPQPLSVRSFWPPYESVIPGHNRTVPELVFHAQQEEGELVVAVEAKRLPHGHDLEQLVREAADTATATNAERLALIMVGVDIGEPHQLYEWERAIRAALVDHGLGAVVELHYSSWAQLGRHIEALAIEGEPLAIYAQDVLAQMALNGLLGYKGAPVALEGKQLNIPNAFELVNNTIKQARQFFLALTEDSEFANLGLTPVSGSHLMLRDGGATRSLNQTEGWFVTTTLFAHFRKPTWAENAGAFAAFFLQTEEDHPYLVAGGYSAQTLTDIQYSFAWSEEVDRNQLANVVLQDADAPLLDTFSVHNGTAWRYATRSWKPGTPDEDLQWTLQTLRQAVATWDHASAAPGPSGGSAG